jgi:Ca2+-binding RTX toxin-like protein
MAIINGTVDDNLLNGTDANDTINPGLGEDTIDGGGGIDRLIINYAASRDRITYASDSVAAEGTGEIFSGVNGVTFTNVEVYNLTGSQFDDDLFGGNLGDTLNGGDGSDDLIGGGGNDILVGGDGDDILTGVGEENGVNSIDTLTGGNGVDSFVFSSADRVFYNDENNSTVGLSNYALIGDFDPSQDLLQLEGSATRYLLASSPITGISGTAIYLDTNENNAFNSTDELIAVLQNDTGLNLTADYFVYV